MGPLRHLVQLLGNHQAVANARRMCDRHRQDEALVRTLAECLGESRPAAAATAA